MQSINNANGHLRINSRITFANYVENERYFREIIMNFVGTFMFIAVGGTALHYWHGYQSENKFDLIVQERQIGLALGALCVIEGAAYLIDLILSFLHFAKNTDNFLE
ncbi:hypothetical protein APICC_08207 [Apis cerana cerana]|uniref:Uncharacterized protein n=1 Tax=Apis cerana cerana TaxID=94128 RepID=A0A2A3ECZ3_APICC|nr:hypothetical protein APICC_08207 [Apis cerana cerana]